MTTLSSPGRMPVPIFRITYHGRSGVEIVAYRDNEAAARKFVAFLLKFSNPTNPRVELIAAAPIDVTESFTK